MIYQTPSSGFIDNVSLSQASLAITLGDPAGIGAEIILKALAEKKELLATQQLQIIGNRSILLRTYAQLQKSSPELNLIHPDDLNIIEVDLDAATLEAIEIGRPNQASGKASFQYLDTAISLTLAGKFQGIVTAPIAKSWWQAAGYNYPGQTEVLAQKAGVERFGMLFVAKSPYTGWRLCTLLATTHIPLVEVAQALTPELMNLKLDLLIEFLEQDFGIVQPTIAIAGLNPHSGEAGKIGTEEVNWLNNWLQSAQSRYPHVNLQGLIPPDTMWVKPGQAWYGKHSTALSQAADGYLALYHDQGLIPVKLMAFDQAINTTIGLPFIRTSPDHGTAFDIAGKGIANPQSMQAAIDLALELAQQRLVN